MRSSPILPIVAFLILSWSVASCQNHDLKIQTVTGEISASEMGLTLPHEHILVDFAMIDSISHNSYNKDSVINKVQPYLDELSPYKVKTFVDCTPAYLGRDPQLLAELSRKTNVNILTNTGWYAADKQRHLPGKMKDMSPEEIALIWIEEAKNGIEGTGIKPGFIKIGMSSPQLTESDKKLVAAACITHLKTGLTIMSHTGPADAALAQLAILKQYGVDPSAFIWTHAMNETSNDKILTVANMGVWVAFDGIRKDLKAQARISGLMQFAKSAGLLDRILLSHDAGWYQPGKPDGGKFRPFTDLFSMVIPLLSREGFTDVELNQMMVKNPAKAFGIRVRKM
jgi:phosphotriesterase-related protein